MGVPDNSSWPGVEGYPQYPSVAAWRGVDAGFPSRSRLREHVCRLMAGAGAGGAGQQSQQSSSSISGSRGRKTPLHPSMTGAAAVATSSSSSAGGSGGGGGGGGAPGSGPLYGRAGGGATTPLYLGGVPFTGGGGGATPSYNSVYGGSGLTLSPLAEDALHLLGRLLALNPDDRPTLTEVLQHPFIVAGRPQGWVQTAATATLTVAAPPSPPPT